MNGFEWERLRAAHPGLLLVASRVQAVRRRRSAGAGRAVRRIVVKPFAPRFVEALLTAAWVAFFRALRLADTHFTIAPWLERKRSIDLVDQREGRDGTG